MAGNQTISRRSSGHAHRNHIEALLVDENLADQVWKAWDAGEINDVDVSCYLGVDYLLRVGP